MKNIFAVTFIAFCLAMSGGFNSISDAGEVKSQGEKMVITNETPAKDKEAAVKEEVKIIDAAEIQKETAEMAGKSEKANKTLN